jgi:hypothetical protein
MPIIQYNVDFPGQDIEPRLAHMLTTDTLAQVMTPGYINPYVKAQGYVVLPTDFVIVAAKDGRLYGYYTKLGETFTIRPFQVAELDQFSIEVEH